MAESPGVPPGIAGGPDKTEGFSPKPAPGLESGRTRAGTAASRHSAALFEWAEEVPRL